MNSIDIALIISIILLFIYIKNKINQIIKINNVVKKDIDVNKILINLNNFIVYNFNMKIISPTNDNFNILRDKTLLIIDKNQLVDKNNVVGKENEIDNKLFLIYLEIYNEISSNLEREFNVLYKKRNIVIDINFLNEEKEKISNDTKLFKRKDKNNILIMNKTLWEYVVNIVNILFTEYSINTINNNKEIKEYDSSDSVSGKDIELDRIAKLFCNQYLYNK